VQEERRKSCRVTLKRAAAGVRRGEKMCEGRKERREQQQTRAEDIGRQLRQMGMEGAMDLCETEQDPTVSWSRVSFYCLGVRLNIPPGAS